MFRVVNDDLSTHDHTEILGEFPTITDAISCEIDNYFFNTSVEQLTNDQWNLVAINGKMCDNEVEM